MNRQPGDKRDYDLAVIGGGPAGCASAFQAANLGLKTILLEKCSYPREKPCGGALSERCLPFLGPRAIRSINCEIEEFQLYAPSFRRFICDPIPGRFVIRREFDQAMAEDARLAGAEVKTNCPVTAINPQSSGGSGGYEIFFAKEKVTAGYIVMSTGYQNNELIKQLGIRERWEKGYLAMCMVSETPIDNKILKSTGFSKKVLGIFFGAVPNGYGWYFVKDGYINIGVGATANLVRRGKIKKDYNHFVSNLKEKGFLPKELELEKAQPFPLPFKKTVARTVYGNILLVGDTAGFVSPVTGEGLYYCLKAGQLAAQAAAGNIKKGIPLKIYHQKCMKAFGNDINKYGYFLRERLYKSRRRMEFAVNLGRRDRNFAEIIKKMIIGGYSYKATIKKSLLRLPVTLFKLIF